MSGQSSTEPNKGQALHKNIPSAETNVADHSIEKWANGSPSSDRLTVQPVSDAVEEIKSEIGKIIVGQGETIELLLIGLFTGGHVLLEGLPGIAKTMIAKLIAKTIQSDFSRIQFTPDLMPTDITGTSVFNLKDSSFHFRKGPVFSNLILIDEINRAPAKTQAALMEVMEEKQLSYDGITYKMDFPFFVMATQNPIEQEGTYSLPEAQLDRFIFRIKMSYPSLAGEQQILHRFHNDFDTHQATDVKKVIDPQKIKEFRAIIEKVFIRPELLNYIAAVVHDTRNNGDLFMGASPRASLSLVRSGKALAAARGRNYVIPDDIKQVAKAVLNHRLILSHEREMEGSTIEQVIDEILQNVEVPR
ncbi:MAG: MoxR family ATPase [Crocinitomicaceae bacterium]|nr:MoxR family ATPase [Crocinitomicaceae bacterium]